MILETPQGLKFTLTSLPDLEIIPLTTWPIKRESKFTIIFLQTGYRQLIEPGESNLSVTLKAFIGNKIITITTCCWILHIGIRSCKPQSSSNNICFLNVTFKKPVQLCLYWFEYLNSCLWLVIFLSSPDGICLFRIRHVDLLQREKHRCY